MLTSEQTILVMRAYWLTHVELAINDPRRTAFASGKLSELMPEKSDTERDQLLTRLLGKELQEQDLLQNFGSVIIDHSVACTQAITKVRELVGKPQEQRRWEDGDQIWINIETALLRTASISKCLFPPNKGRRHQARGELLRRGLHTPEKYLDAVRRARNVIEHFDEHLDDAFVKHPRVSDRVIAPADETPRELGYVIRHFDPNTGVVRIVDREVNIYKLAGTLTTLLQVVLHNVRMWGRHSEFPFAPFED